MPRNIQEYNSSSLPPCAHMRTISYNIYINLSMYMFAQDIFWAIDIQMPFRCLGANEPYLVGALEPFFLFPHIGESSSQLTFTPSFFRGVGRKTTEQIIINHH